MIDEATEHTQRIFHAFKYMSYLQTAGVRNKGLIDELNMCSTV